MFCYQCEQTACGIGCTKIGVCGKSSEVADLQDLLVYVLQGLSVVAIKAQSVGVEDPVVDRFICEGLFTTVTNVSFDVNVIAETLRKAVDLREALKEKAVAVGLKCDGACNYAAKFQLAEDLPRMIMQGQAHSIMAASEDTKDMQSLKNILLFGIKGIAAYADHAAILGKEDIAVYHFLQKALATMLRNDLTIEEWVALNMECGQINLQTMELLDEAHTSHYGHPVPTAVPLGAKQGKAILISGHDLHDLELLLQQTEGRGIYIYTHGEMLPAHGYPKLKAYKHFYGHYGTAWQNQQKEFDEFPGAILMTTNCIQKPIESYQDNIFTTGLVSWPNVQHIGNDKDFSKVIERALQLPGFAEDSDKGTVNVGFAHNTVLSIAGTVIDAVKAGKIRHFFLVAGCDGAKPGRNYYTEFVEKVPNDCIVLTLACGKFRFFDKQLGDIDGIPRLLDIGQCNDAYSAIKIAVALAKAFNCGVNDLPLSMILSWYEQKAVAILLTLLSLGIKNIRLGPSLPAFITPNVLNFLVEKFNIKPIKTPDLDLQEILG
jgi:hydroxylamine reductase